MLIEEALAKMLAMHDGVKAIVANRIYPLTLPHYENQTTLYPALLYGLDKRPRSQTHDGPDGLVQSYYLLDCIAEKYIDAKRLANQVRLALNGKSAELAAVYGAHIKGVFLENEQDDYVRDMVENLSLYDIEMRLRIHHREALDG